MHRNPLIPAGAAAVIGRLFLGPMRDVICVIQRPSSDIDPGGAPVTGGYGTVDVRDCRIVRSGFGTEGIRGGRAEASADYEARLPVGSDVRDDDRIIVIDLFAGTEAMLEVTGPATIQTHGLELVTPVNVTT